MKITFDSLATPYGTVTDDDGNKWEILRQFELQTRVGGGSVYVVEFDSLDDLENHLITRRVR